MDTGGTICKASELMIANEAKSVRAICTHAILSGNAYDNISNSSLEELVVTNSLPLQKNQKKIKVLDISDLFAKTIKNVDTNKSISSQFIV
jgi:ribose-phosphate pyrophosphokinase